LAFLYPLAAKALDHGEAVLARDAPDLATLTTVQRMGVVRRVLFSVLVGILGESVDKDTRKLSFFAAGDDSIQPQLSSPTPAEVYVAGQIASLLANRAAGDGIDGTLPLGVAGVIQAWKSVVATSFSDGQQAGQEALQVASMFYDMARFASVVVFEPYVAEPTVPVVCQQFSRKVLPGFHSDKLSLLKLSLRTGMHGNGTQSGHYETVVVSDEAKLKVAAIDNGAEVRRLKDVLFRMRELMRKLAVVAPVPPASASSGSPTGCASCRQAFDKVVPEQKCCMPCGMKKAASASPTNRVCAVCEAANMSSALPTNLACVKCSAALQLSAEQRAQNQKKEQAEQAKEAQKKAAAKAAQVEAEYKAKQLELDKARQLELDKARNPDKPQRKCVTCNTEFVQKVESHKSCFSCVAKARQTGAKTTSTAIKCVSCQANFQPRQAIHTKCDNCWGVAPKPKADVTKAGSTGTGSSQASAAKPANPAPKSGAQASPRTEVLTRQRDLWRWIGARSVSMVTMRHHSFSVHGSRRWARRPS